MPGQNSNKIRSLLDAVDRTDTGDAHSFLAPDVEQHGPDTITGSNEAPDPSEAGAPGRSRAEIVRLLEDGAFVVAQLSPAISGIDRFAVYHFDGENVAQQWVFSSPTAPPNQSGHTQVDGPAEPRDLGKTEENKRFARMYYETFHLAGDHRHNDEFFMDDVMIRHEPGVQDGLRHFLHDVEELMKRRTIDSIGLLIGQGDLVFIVASGTHEGKSCAYIDLYRVEDRKVVEHWGFPQMTSTSLKLPNAYL